MRGWIEVNTLTWDTDDKSVKFFRKIFLRVENIRELLEINREGAKRTESPESEPDHELCNADIVLNSLEGYKGLRVKESYDELKQKIIEASE